MRMQSRVLATYAAATMPGSQVTQLEHHMNELVVVIFVVLVAVALLCSLANDSFLRRCNATAWYMWTEGCEPPTHRAQSGWTLLSDPEKHTRPTSLIVWPAKGHVHAA